MQKQPHLQSELRFCRLDLPPEFPIALMPEDKWYSALPAGAMLHFHNCLQVGYCQEGQGYTIIDGVLYPYEKGSVSIIPTKVPHFCTSHHNVVSHWKWLYLDPLALLPRSDHGKEKALLAILYGRDKLPYTINWTDSPQIIQIVQSIILELEGQGQGYHTAVRGLVQALSAILVRMASSAPSKPEGRLCTTLQLIAPAVEYITLHYPESITVPQLAELCHISPTHLRRMFRQIMDCSPLEYLQLTRMEAACALLMHTDISVLEVGSRAGFATSTCFTRQFKKTFGTTPGQWGLQRVRRSV